MHIVVKTPEESKMEPVPYTAESIALAKAARETEQAEALARILAIMHDYLDVDHESEATRKHFAYWAWVALRGSALSAGQFRLAVAVHHAAQTGIDWYFAHEGCELIDLLDPENWRERRDWNELAQKMILAYRDVLGDPLKAELVRRLYQMEQEASHGDPRRI